MATFTGDFHAPTGRFGLVAARFNSIVVEQLVGGARDGLVRHGVAVENIDLAYVPGSLEIPLIARQLAASGRYAAIICLGAVIQGETSHYDIVSNVSAKGIADAAMETGVPIINAILTTHTVEQAVNRAGAKQGNKGFEAAIVAIEMVNLMGRLPGPAR